MTYNNGPAYTFTWQNGRELASTVLNGVTSSYEYNADGLRTQKTVGTTVYDYYWFGTQLTMMTITEGETVKTLKFYYDANGTPVILDYNGTTYYYVTNLQGDVMGLANSYGIVAYYEYDAWGRIIKTESATTAEYNAITANPLRYRGYIYDTETGFYYLRSRYYDPIVGRFVNADDSLYLGDSNTLLSYNLFAYCENNPVNKIDPTGHMAVEATLAATNWWNPVGWGATILLVVEITVVVSVVYFSVKESTVEAVKKIVEEKHERETYDQSVYYLKDSSGNIKYIGRTNDPARRREEHKNDPKHPERKEYEMEVFQTGLNVRQARTLEQMVISAYSLEKLENARREISKKKIGDFDSEISDIKNLWATFAEDELKNLMEG